MKWTDVLEIAIALDENYPDEQVLSLNFVRLHEMVMGLDGFDDNPNNSNEKILEAIQMAWLDEK